MKIISEEKLKNIKYNGSLLGSESDLFNCTYNKNEYLLKKLFYYLSEDHIQKLYSLSKLKTESLVLPKYLIYNEYQKICGYLVLFYENYKSFYDIASESKETKIKLLKQAKEKIISMHDNGIIHRDLHPANIIYQDNDVKLIDFDSCFYNNITTGSYNKFSKSYLEINKLSPSIDIFNFNLDTISILYNIQWNEILNFEYVFEERLDSNQKEIWVKTKQKKELTNNDFLIDFY